MALPFMPRPLPDELAVDEGRASADQRDQVRSVHGTPAGATWITLADPAGHPFDLSIP
ncbi:hypothetical protein [Nonomuraea jiangxiensis]|uniref:hypothetical protein n=1 Tax=Nonomuraea jiangxiensis TaxID=633440 RepID=UPI0015A3DC17|nr:hypothetical protein [Nonomuraea jiangxiensis]